MAGKEKTRRRAPSATPWDGLPEGQLTPSQAVTMRSMRSMYAFRHEAFDGDVDFFNGYARDACPRCGSGEVAHAGLDRRGIQTYLCHGCGRKFTPMTGTIFDDRKLPVSAWADFILQAISYESVNAMTREDRRSDTTSPYWLAKLFLVLAGVQDDVVLSGTVWADETYRPVARRDEWRKPDGTLPRGLSRNQICIGVGVDDSGRSLFMREGLGKTSKSKTRAAFGSHIEPGSLLIHDMEGAHDVLVGELELASVACNARYLKGVPDRDNPLRPVNHMCFLLQAFLDRHTGFNRDNIQGYLDLFSVAMNPPEDKMEKVANVLDRAMRCPKTLRFRDFYKVRSRSERCEEET